MLLEIYVKWKSSRKIILYLLMLYTYMLYKIQDPTTGTVVTLFQMVAQVAKSNDRINCHTKF